MNINNKLIILLTFGIISICTFIYLQKLKTNVLEQSSLYEKTSNEISVIKQLKTYYGDKKSNKRKIYNIINRYTAKTLTRKEDKNSLEFTISKLNHKELDNLNKSILNSGIKVLKFKIKKLNKNSAELFCKVAF